MERQIEKYFQEELNADERLDFLKQIESDNELKKQFIKFKNTIRTIIIFRCRLREKDYSRQLHPVLV